MGPIGCWLYRQEKSSTGGNPLSGGLPSCRLLVISGALFRADPGRTGLVQRTQQRRGDDINLNGVHNVAPAAAANEVQRFVHASSTAVYDLELARGQSDIGEDLAIGKGDSFSYYSNGKARAERTLSEVLGSSGTVVTFLRPVLVVGPRNRATVDSMRETAANIPGCDPRCQYIHEEDVAAAFQQAVLADTPGAYKVVPDDFIRLSEVWQIIGLESVRTVPWWAARPVTAVRWRFFGSQTHSSWLNLMMVDATASNAKLRATGWIPTCGSADALRSAL